MIASDIYACIRSPRQPELPIAIAREFSPRWQRRGSAGVVLDLGGLGRLLGDAHAIGAEIDRACAARCGDRVAFASIAIAVAPTQTSALLLAAARAGLTVVIGDPAPALAAIPLGVLHQLLAEIEDATILRSRRSSRRTAQMARRDACDQAFSVLARWGLTTLADLAGLPGGDLSARLGQEGVALQIAARGIDRGPLVPDADVPRFLERMELEWPIDGLEPLSFVFARLLEPLSIALERADRGAAAIRLNLRLVNRTEHVRMLQLPAVMRDARVLRTLLTLDLESHPPSAAIDVVTIEIDPAPGRIVQSSLLERARPSAETLATLMARLAALTGSTRVGCARLLDSHQPDGFEMRPFAPGDARADPASGARCRTAAVPAAVPSAGGDSRRRRAGTAGPRRRRSARHARRERRAMRRTLAIVRRVVGPRRPSVEPRRVGSGAQRRIGLPRVPRSRQRHLVHGRRFRLTRLQPILNPNPQSSISDPQSAIDNRHVYRTPHLLGLFLPGWRVAARNARAARGVAGISRAGAARSRRRLRHSALSSRRQTRRPESHRRRRADAVGGQSRARARGSELGEIGILSGSRVPSPESRIFRLAVLVASREGYRNLCRLTTRMKLAAPKGEGALTFDDLDGHVGGLVALAGRAVIDGPRYGIGGLVDRLVGVFGAKQVCVELQRHLLRDEEHDNHTLRDLAAAFRLPVIATNGVRFAEASDRPLYDVLTCIRHKTTLELAGRRLSWNAERSLKPPEEMARLFADLPEAIAGTRDLAERLEYSMADLGYRFPEYPVPHGETMASFLRKMTQAGARERYRPFHDRARAQIARELDLIERLDLAGYFLIVWDIVNYCRQQDILVQGRGSAANSAVCYSLGITAVDPVGMDLLFERFLSEERGEWPDIDLDLPSGDRRERVIQRIYEKYGKLGVGMTANVITYRGRSAAREVGKTLSLEAGQIDRLAKIMNQFEWVDPKETMDRNLRDAGLDAEDPAIRRFAELWVQIQDLPRHLGQHSGGMVICQGRLDEVVPLENASMPDRVVIQWDKDDCADMGLVKVDLLGLGMMAVLQDALTLVNRRLGARGRAPSPRTRDRRPGPSSPRRSCRLSHAAGGGHDWPLSGGIAGADGDAPAAQARALLRHRRRGGHHQARADRGADGASVPEAAAGARAGRVSAPVARADPRADAGRAVVPGAAAAHGDGRRGIYRRRGGGAAPCVRLQAIREAHAADRREAARRHGAAGHHRRCRRPDRSIDHVVRALRISRIARGQLRAPGVRERVSQGALSVGLLHRPAEQPADGVLSPGHAREGRAAARRALRPDRRAAVGLGVPGRSRRPRAAGAHVCERAQAGSGKANGGSWIAECGSRIEDCGLRIAIAARAMSEVRLRRSIHAGDDAGVHVVLQRLRA